jgi:hypothetical protein
MMAGLIMATVRLFAALKRVLEIRLYASVINSYGGARSIGESRARLERDRNIGSRSGANKGKCNDATKRSELCKLRVSWPWS